MTQGFEAQSREFKPRAQTTVENRKKNAFATGKQPTYRIERTLQAAESANALARDAMSGSRHRVWEDLRFQDAAFARVPRSTVIPASPLDYRGIQQKQKMKSTTKVPAQNICFDDPSFQIRNSCLHRDYITRACD